MQVLRATWFDLFWSKVREMPSGCWEWQAAMFPTGYGKVGGRSKTLYAHRTAYELANGVEVPSGMFVMHACDNRRCVRPDHLSAGTPEANAQDMWKKGRGISRVGDASGSRTRPERRPRGEQNVRAKLTEHMVRELRRLYDAGGVTCRTLGAQFGVSGEQARAIARRKSWRHVA